MPSYEEKMRLLNNALGEIEKEYGHGMVMNVEDEKISNIDVVSSGSINIDKALGIGGYPRGRIIEIYGGEMTAKTTIALHSIVECQKNGGILRGHPKRFAHRCLCIPRAFGYARL